MFLQKLLSGRNTSKTKLDLLAQSWSSIQKYYETAADALKDAVDLTPIPTALQNIVKLIQAEELEYERANDTLETGPCLEYLLQRRVLEELVEFAKVDTPFGMRIHCLRFFCSLVINVHAQLLPERAVHVPLQKLISSCHRLIAHHYEQLEIEPEACSEERHAAIAELSLELVKLMHGVFSHFKGTNAALMDLFFERGWCRGLGENVWRSSKDGKTSHKRRESLDEKIQWNMFLMPRFDMFTQLIDFMNVPGETGEIAREAILFALRLLEGDPEYVCYIVEYSGFCEVMAERLAVLFALLPKNNGAFTFASNNRVVPVRPPKRRIQFSIPAMITNNSLMITVNAHNSFRRKRRKRSPFDTNFIRTLENIKDGELLLDHFYSFWEYLNDVARVADKRLMTALMAQLTTSLWHPVVCTALSSPNIEAATAATAYTTEMIRSLTDQTLLHAFLVVLVGEEGGVGKDLEPEIKLNNSSAFIGLDDDDDNDDDDDDNDNDDNNNSNNNLDNDVNSNNSNNNNNNNNEDDDNQSNHSNSKKRGHDENGSDKASLPRSSSEQRSLKSNPGVSLMDDDLTLRLLLIHRVDSEDMDLSLSTLRLFDTILETYNQFAIYNLVLRNFVDIGPDGEYVSSSSLTTNRITNNNSNSNNNDNDKSLEKTTEPTHLDVNNEINSSSENKDNDDNKANENDVSKSQKENKKEKVRWLVERVLSLLPLEDELERMKSPALSAIIAQDKGQKLNHTGNSNGQVIPGNSYDDYFHEARERFQYGILARNFWQFPYPPIKNKQDAERETEDKKGRPKRPKSMVVGREAVRMMNDSIAHFGRKSSFSSHGSNNEENDIIKKCESYEGLFLSRIFDLFSKMLEASMEQNLLVTSILQKIAGLVDRRVDGVICDWRTIRVGEDGSLYGGVWTLPTTNSAARRSLYALLEQVTFEALKRAQLVPNFETRISLAKKKGVNLLLQSPSSSNQSQFQQQQEPIQQALRSTASALHLTAGHSNNHREPPSNHRGLSKQPSLTQLMFQNKHNNSNTTPSLPTNQPSSSKSSTTSTSSSSSSSKDPNSPPLPARLDLSASTLNGTPNNNYDGLPTASSPSALFFQQKANATPVTMTNPFVNFPNFVHAYIVLQEFCKELAAVILVRHATKYPDEPFPNSSSSSTYNSNNMSTSSSNSSLSTAPNHSHLGMMTRQKMMAAWHHDQYYLPTSSSQQQLQQISNHSYYYSNSSSPFSPIHSPISLDLDSNKKWRNRMSVATMSTLDWRSQLDTIDESSRRLNNLRSPI